MEDHINKRDTESQPIMLLDLLPVELLHKVLFHLDRFALRSLLQSSLHISRQCVLLVERRYPERPIPLFFIDCPGLTNIPLAQYNPSTHRQVVKLYLAEYDCTDILLNFTAEALVERFPYINKNDSIMFYSIPTPAYFANTAIIIEHNISTLLHKERIAFHALPIGRNDTLVHSLTDPLLSIEPPSPPGIYKGPGPDMYCNESYRPITGQLTRVRIEGVETVEGAVFHAKVISITIIFHKSHKNPVIRDLTFSHFGFDLSIYYEEKVPLIENLTFPFRPRADRDPTIDGGLLTLAHTPSLPGHLNSPLPTHPDEGRDLSYLSELTQCYRYSFFNIKIIGGPNTIIESLRIPNIYSLDWKQTCEPSQQLDHARLFNCHLLKHFKFESLLKSAKCPHLLFIHLERRLEFFVSIIGHNGMDITGLTLPRFLHSCRLSIYVDTKDTDAYVSSIAEIWPYITRYTRIDPLEWHQLENGRFYSLSVVGLRWDPPNIIPEMLEEIVNSIKANYIRKLRSFRNGMSPLEAF